MPIPAKQLGAATSDAKNVKYNMVCVSTVVAGDWVRMSSTTVVRAQADSAANGAVFGVCILKPSSLVCHVRVGGYTEDLFTTLNTEKMYFLDETNPGQMTDTPPTGSGEVLVPLGRPVTDKALALNIGQLIVRS